jgi:DsbC/DsbD-like thiol-disulfide interchange protein
MRLLFQLLLSMLAIFAPASAQAASDEMNYGGVRLLDGWPMANGNRMIAVAVQLNDGWKTYWRAPGESGIPPQFSWIGSQNLAKTEVRWPRPEVFDTFGLQTVGYKHDVIIPVEITPRDPSKPIDIALQFNFGACSDICIPAQGEWTTKLTLEPADMDSRDNLAILAALKTEPVTATAQHLNLVTCTLRPDGEGFRLSAMVELAGPAPASTVTLFEAGNPDIWIGTSTTSVSGRSLSVVAPLENYGAGGLVIDRSELRLTVLGNGIALDIQGCPAS